MRGGAADVLRPAEDGSELGSGGQQEGLGLIYALVPESRPRLRALEMPGAWARSFDIVRAAVDGELDQLVQLDLSDLGLVRAVLHFRLAAILAVRLHSVGRPEATVLLEALGPSGRAAVRDLAEEDAAAVSLLAAVPAPPTSQTTIAVLGPTELGRDGGTVADLPLRSERVRALLAYLVTHRSTTRRAVMAALWPGLEERAATNNLRDTLNQLHGVLEPRRDTRDPPYFVRSDDHELRLVTGDALHIDVDQFDGHLAAAARAEDEGLLSVALDHYIAAAGLYRGDLFADVDEAEWFVLDRDHRRAQFVRAAVRAGQLLVGQGDSDGAGALAQRALKVDRWSEEAHGVRVAAALECGDLTAARQALELCTAMLVERGVEPSDATRRLARRVRPT